MLSHSAVMLSAAAAAAAENQDGNGYNILIKVLPSGSDDVITGDPIMVRAAAVDVVRVVANC